MSPRSDQGERTATSHPQEERQGPSRL
jgi:hypothetical protein